MRGAARGFRGYSYQRHLNAAQQHRAPGAKSRSSSQDLTWRRLSREEIKTDEAIEDNPAVGAGFAMAYALIRVAENIGELRYATHRLGCADAATQWGRSRCSPARSRYQDNRRVGDAHDDGSPMIESIFGPFAPNLDRTEFVGCCRCLRAIVFMTVGERSPVFVALKAAETSPGALLLARRAFDALPAATKKHVLSSYVAVTSPTAAEDDGPRLSKGRR